MLSASSPSPSSSLWATLVLLPIHGNNLTPGGGISTTRSLERYFLLGRCASPSCLPCACSNRLWRSTAVRPPVYASSLLARSAHALIFGTVVRPGTRQRPTRSKITYASTGTFLVLLSCVCHSCSCSCSCSHPFLFRHSLPFTGSKAVAY